MKNGNSIWHLRSASLKDVSVGGSAYASCFRLLHFYAFHTQWLLWFRFVEVYNRLRSASLKYVSVVGPCVRPVTVFSIFDACHI